MAENSQDLPRKLAQARQDLQQAQARIAELEAALAIDFMPPESPTPPLDRPLQKLMEDKSDPIALTNARLTSTEQAAQRQAAEAAAKRYAQRMEMSKPAVRHAAELEQHITEIQRTNEALRRSESLFRAIFEHAAVGIIRCALDGRCLQVNQRFCEIVGYTNEELVQTNFQAFTHPEDLADNLKGIRQLAQGEIPFYATQKRYVHQHGHIVWVNLTVSLVCDAQGRPDYCVGLVEDITQFKQTEQALVQSEDRYRRMVEDQVDLIGRFQTDFKLTFVNRAYSEAFNKRPDELIGQSILDLIPQEYHAGVIAHLATITPTGPTATSENPLLVADGTLRWFQWTNQVIVDDTGRPVEYQAVGRDITDQKKLQMERKLTEAAEREQRRFAEALHNSLAALTASLDVKSVMQLILDYAATVVPYDAGSIILFEGNYGRVAYLRGFAPEAMVALTDYRFPIESLTYGNMFVNKAPYFVADTQAAPEWISVPLTDWIRSSIGIPIEIRGKIIGVLVVDSATPYHFQPTDIEKLQAFARYASLALENAYHVTELEQRVSARTAELQAAKERVEAILNNSLDGILLVDPDLRIQQTNLAFNTLVGYAPNVDLYGSLRDLIHLDDWPHVNEIIQTVVRERAGQQVEMRCYRKNGTLFDAELSIGYIKANGLVLTLRDITERKAQERQLRYQASLQENVSDAVIATDTEFRIQSWNKAAERIYGWTAEESIGKVAPEFLQIRFPSAQDMETELKQFNEYGSIQRETTQRRKDGTDIFILGSATRLKDNKGVPFGIIAINRDITERMLTEEALQKSSAEIHDLYNNAPCGYHSIDKHGLIVQINDTELQWLGYARDEVVGKLKVTALFTPESVQVFQKAFRVFMGRGWINDVELDMVRKDGSMMHILLNATAVYDAEGQYLKSRSTLFDITELRQTQQAIAASEAHYRLLAENISDVIDRTNPDGIRTFITPSCYGLLGYAPDELVGQPSIDIVHPDDNPAALAAVIQAVSHGKTTFSFILRFRHKAGRDVWVEVTNNIIYDQDTGKLLEIIRVLRDITERKKAETELHETEHRYHALFEQSHDAVFLVDMRGKLLEVNHRAAEMLGYSIEELRTLSYRELSGEVAHSEVLIKHLLAGEPIPMYERVMRKKDGSRISVEISVEIVRDLDGNLRHIQSVVRDITERKQAEEAMRESEARYRLLAENLADIIMTFSIDRQITYMSPSCEKLLGYLPEEIQGKSHSEFIHPEDYPRVIARTRQAVVSKEYSYTNQFRIRHNEGHYIWYEVRTRLVLELNTGNVVQFVSVLRDITERKQAEDALRESEEKFRLLLEAAPIATVISDQRGQIMLVNDQAEKLFGYHRNELVHQPVGLLVPDYARNRHTANQKTYVAAPRVRRMGSGLDLLARRKDGSDFPVEIELSYIETQAGLLVMSFVIDITERKQNAAALEEQRAFLRQVIDVSPNMIFVKDYNARFVLVNPIVAQMYNTTVAALLGKSDADFNPNAQEVAAFLAADRRVIDSEEPLFIEEPLTSSTGETHWLQTTKVPIISADGQSKYVLGVAADITARKKAEEALRQNEELLRTVLENLPVGIWIIDPDGMIRQSNLAGQQIWGGAQSISMEAHNEYQRWWDDPGQLDATDDWAGARAITKAAVRAMLAGETTLADELEIEAFDGAHKFILNSAIPIRDPGQKIQGVIVVNQDITERKQNEKRIHQAFEREKELSELKSRFVSMASHEFRTPLASILALTETLRAYRHRLADEQIEQRLGKIQEQVGHLKDIMEDVLQLARLQARRTEFNPTWFNLDSLCQSILDEFQSWPDVSHRFLYTSNDALRQVKLDKKLIRQIINNLVSNAIKYSPPATTIRVKLAYTDEMFVLAVRDQGIGIPAADLPHLFEPFHRAVNVGTIAGTGLGLVITKESVELHGGTIVVESQVGAGTTFTVRIPIVTSGAKDHGENPRD